MGNARPRTGRSYRTCAKRGRLQEQLQVLEAKEKSLEEKVVGKPTSADIMDRLQQRRQQDGRSRGARLPSGEDEEKGAGSARKNMVETRRVARLREETAASAARASSKAGGTSSRGRPGEDIATSPARVLANPEICDA
eukprot:825509-Pyramimonas_sp.AAC.1